MIYKDGVKTNENNRVLECPNCKNAQIGDDDRYCIICGTELYNLCVGEPLYDNFGNYDGPGEQHVNPSNARFCAYCGQKTVYFEKGFLKPFDEYVENSEIEIQAFPQSDSSDSEDSDLPF